MARIGILTYHFVPNYGAAMQAWGLQKALEALGHEAFLIDYRPSHLTTGGMFHFPKDAWSRRANLVIAYQKAMALKRLLRGDGGKHAKFEAFHAEHLNIEGSIYKSNKELRLEPPIADAYICGSDQIWNASEQYGIDSSYFLDFAPAGIKLISYAASFGRPVVHARFRDRTSELISKIDAISVREQSAVGIVNSLCERDATWVPDPTLLPDDGYPEAIVPSVVGDYLFSYTLRSRELVAQVEDALARELGLEVVSPAKLAVSGVGAPSPLEWLGYIKSAKCVITNSYHGTLFSIIFRRPFVFVGLSGSKSGYNERAKSLLSRLGLTDRMLNDGDLARLPEMIDTAIDWARVQREVDRWRQQSIEFLKTAIGS